MRNTIALKQNKWPAFTKKDKKKRTILIPNLSPEFAKIVQVSIEAYGCKTQPVEMANQEALDIGKKYVHNDICFPAQINIGELIYALNKGEHKRDEVAIAIAKNCNACRALQYYALARNTLDQCGYTDVPIITSGKDQIGMHPGLNLTGLTFQLKTMQGVLFVDAINFMRNRLIPYEVNKGECERLHDEFVDKGLNALRKNYRRSLRVLKEAVEAFNKVKINTETRKPRVMVIGEILVNFHPSSNHKIVQYLLDNGMEVVLPPLVESFRQDVFNQREQADRRLSKYPWLDKLGSRVSGLVYTFHMKPLEKIMSNFKFYEKHEAIETIAGYAEGVIDRSFSSGEGWVIPGEITSMAKKGVESFIIVQPFGCLPNHITGRGSIKVLKERFPNIQIISLDYDPDISIGNIENRLQMLILGAKEKARKTKKKQ